MNKLKRSAQATVRERKQKDPAPVVDLAQAREQHRRQRTERRVRDVLDDNRGALSRLFASGLIFTQKGSRCGRDLLGAHHALLKVVDLIARFEEGAPGVGRLELKAEDLFRDLETQLTRAMQLSARAGEYIAGRGRD
ncbi:MAG: hypothetical protein JST92_04755 [Deltaproteobacteria bacterium]|nr:hypothetical protein [Deltaproteobacteria bacterium]